MHRRWGSIRAAKDLAGIFLEKNVYIGRKGGAKGWRLTAVSGEEAGQFSETSAGSCKSAKQGQECGTISQG